MRSSARGTFKRLRRELGKTWKYSRRPTLKNLNFESVDDWGKLGSNLSFTVKNKNGNLHNKAAHISNIMNEISHYLKF